jgi:hypothetical protein
MGRSEALTQIRAIAAEGLRSQEGDALPFEKLERIESIAAACADGDDDHLDFVHVVEVEGRYKGIYVFAERSTRERFRRAVEDGETTLGERNVAFEFQTPIYTGPAAERLIASERADVLEGMGLPAIAQKLRLGGTALPHDAAPGSDARALIQRWAEEDAQGGQS